MPHPCTCTCHDPGSAIIHFVACCEGLCKHCGVAYHDCVVHEGECPLARVETEQEARDRKRGRHPKKA